MMDNNNRYRLKVIPVSRHIVLLKCSNIFNLLHEYIKGILSTFITILISV